MKEKNQLTNKQKKKKQKQKNAAAIACTAKGCVCWRLWSGEGGHRWVDWWGAGGGGVRWAGWRTVALLRVVSLFLCLLACSFFLVFFFFISNRKERILVAVVCTHLVRGTKTVKQEKRKVHVSVNVSWVGRNNFNKKIRSFKCLYRVLQFLCLGLK